MSGANRDGRWSNRGNRVPHQGVPLSGEGIVSHCPSPRHPLPPNTKGTRVNCRWHLEPAQLPICHFPCPWCSQMGQPSSPKLSSKPSAPFLSPKPCRAGMGLGAQCWAQRDRMGQAAGRTPQGRHSSVPSLLHHPHVQPPHSSDPTGATEGRLKPRLGTAWLMAPEALHMNCQHRGAESHRSHPLQEGKRAAESLNCC